MEPKALKKGRQWLDGREGRHLSKVLRVAEGTRLEVFDGAGRLSEALVHAVKNQAVCLQIEPPRLQAPRAFPATLALCLTKGKGFERVLRYATEMGSERIVPLFSERTEVLQEPDRYQAKHARWRQITLEAGKQSGASRLPSVEIPQSLDDFLEERRPRAEGYLSCCASLRKNALPLRLLSEQVGEKKAFLALVGPEGDFTCQEYDKIEEAGFRPTRLTDTVLKADTAALYLMSAWDCLSKPY